jgi:hypothetical protein
MIVKLVLGVVGVAGAAGALVAAGGCCDVLGFCCGWLPCC